MLKKFIGDKAFYKMVLAIAIPIIIQNAITNIVSLVDNVMVGKIGTLPMSGVSIANQLLNVYLLAMFGGINAASLFLAQYAGKKDDQGIKNCFNLKIYISIIVNAVFIIVFIIFGKKLIGSFLDEKNALADNLQTLEYGWTYLVILLFSLFPFGFKEALSSTLRELGETFVPMIASSCAIIINVFLNFVLIFGYLGFPELGIVGAAVATVIARILEFGLVWLLGFKKKNEIVFLQHPFTNVIIDSQLIKNVVYKGSPLLCNEILWSVSLAGISQCYSTRGLDAVAAVTIMNTLNNVYCIVCNAMGVSLGIIIGQILGTGDCEKAKQWNTQIIAFSVFLSTILGTIFFFASPFFSNLYNVSDLIKDMATELLLITAIKLPIQALYMCCYFTLRSGGKTLITFFFDSFSSAFICWPVAFFLAKYTGLTLVQMYIIICLIDVVKGGIGIWLIKSNIWVQSLVN